MRKKVGIIKRLFCLLLIFLLSINSFAAIVSDNDGSAFITKAEFDALKASFQAQIDTYNASIDSKIDGAIASYLAGIRLSTKVEQTDLYKKCFTFGRTQLYWNRQLSTCINPMPVQFCRVVDGMVTFSKNEENYWGSHTLAQNSDTIMKYENRIMVKDASSKIFDGIKRCQETANIFTISNGGKDVDADAYSRRFMDNYLWKQMDSKKFNEAAVGIFAKNSEKAGTLAISYAENDVTTSDMNTLKAGITWIAGKKEWGMKTGRTMVNKLGHMQDKCVSGVSILAYTNMTSMYTDSYNKILGNYGTTDTSLPKSITENFASSSYDNGWYYNGTESSYWKAPMANWGSADAKYTGAHGKGILNPVYDICCTYIGDLLDWQNASDNLIAGMSCTYQQGRPVCKCTDNGVLTLKVKCHGTGKLKFYVNTSGSDLWQDIRGNSWGGRTRKWTTVSEYDSDYSTWPAASGYTDGSTKTFTLNVKKDDIVFCAMCDNSTTGSYMEFEEITIEREN